MICSKCRSHYNTLACPVCTAHRSRLAVQDYQRRYIADVLAGKLRVRLAHPTGPSPRPHLELFDFHGHAWCGSLLDGKHKRSEAVWGASLRAEVCRSCLDAFDRVSASAARTEQAV